MQFQITKIDFDFSDAMADESITDEYKQEVIDETLSCVWEVIDEDDLIEEITSATGWCINSIDFYHILR
jgi:hypothetical protein